jgi:hypothetical protein
MKKRRTIEDYETVLEIPNLSNRKELVEKYLELLREQLRSAIADSCEHDVKRIDEKMKKIKGTPSYGVE